MECKISLEQQVINALIRRKTHYLCAAMDSPEYKKAAGKAKAETASYSLLAKNHEVAESAKELCEIIDSVNSDELYREEFAAMLAYHTYNNVQETRRKAAELAGYSETFENALKDSVRQKTDAWKRNMERQYGLVMNIAENCLELGDKTALSKEGIESALRTRYHSAKEYLEFEAELQDSIEAFSQLNAELATLHRIEINMETAEIYGDKMESPEPLFYISLISEKAVLLAKLLSMKAAEIEANEVFRK
ncbi:MAG: hypothetical protein PHO02_04335 [Candidatus Nanoarchaeia archaeon]|nr:hypothetical protein [Candidatus Nanoarchaeia archaeon]